MKRIIFVLVAFVLAGCNVQEKDGSSDDNGSYGSATSCTPRTYEELSQYGYGCRETLPTSTSSSSNTGSGSNTGGSDAGGTQTGSSRSANIARYAEYEPNNVLENANPVNFPVVSGDTVPGIEITGSVWDVSDESDYFIMSPNQSGSYAIYLCADTCTEHPTDSMVAIRVIDQFGTVIAENPLYEESTKFLIADLYAGMPYYVQVFGFDTQQQEYQYKLVIID